MTRGLQLDGILDSFELSHGDGGLRGSLQATFSEEVPEGVTSMSVQPEWLVGHLFRCVLSLEDGARVEGIVVVECQDVDYSVEGVVARLALEIQAGVEQMARFVEFTWQPRQLEDRWPIAQ